MQGTLLPTKIAFLTGAAAVAAAFLLMPGERAEAATSAGCEGGGFTIVLPGGRTVGQGDSTVAASALGTTFLVRGRYIEFTVVSGTFGVKNYLFTGAANALDITGGRRTVVFASKTPDHKGLVLNSAMTVESDGADLVIERSGTGGLDMKIQAKDCATGGLFQMEPERGDDRATRITHTLAPEQFYFDNPRFRAREGDTVPFKDTTVVVAARVNITNNLSRKFVARDSSQSADRLDEPTCRNLIRTRTGDFDDVLHCGGVSRWDVASGGRMGFVSGEDAIEVSPPTPDCTHQCRNRTQVGGQSVKLGFPFPAPRNLQPRTP